jgi:hypothetical protein
MNQEPMLTQTQKTGTSTTRLAHKFSSLVLTLLVSMVWLNGCTTQPPGNTADNRTPSPAQSESKAITNVRFEQLDLRINEGRPNAVVAKDSGWGYLYLSYRGADRIQYLNLTAGESWAVQNLPLVSVSGAGAEQNVAVAFGLGVEPGTAITELKYGISLTDTPVDAQPRSTETARVADGQIVFTDGEPDETPLVSPRGPGRPLAGGAADDTPHTNDKDFPNQESNGLLCVPVAISNSLKWLKKTQNIPDDQLSPADTDIQGWVDRFGTTPEAGTTDPTWPQKKADYFKKKNVPIETTFIPPGDIGKVGELLDKDCDVELRGRNHTASIVGITKTKDGKYSITVRHDTNQGSPGGTVDEVVTYDPATGKITGGTFLDGKDIRGFVVECYKKPEGKPTPAPKGKA